jgi:hypothetical protein
VCKGLASVVAWLALRLKYHSLSTSKYLHNLILYLVLGRANPMGDLCLGKVLNFPAIYKQGWKIKAK